MTPVGFEPTISAGERPQTYALDRAATETGIYVYSNVIILVNYIFTECGPGSSVGIATDYGLDGPGSNPGGDEVFRPFRPALGPTQPPVKWVTGLSRG